MNFLPLVTPIIRQVAPVITEKIKNKICPSEIQQAILAGIKAAETEEDEKLPLQQHLFYKSKPDSLHGVPAFLENYFKIAAVQNELAKSFNNEGKPDVDYLVEQFKKTAGDYQEVNPIEERIKPWLTTFSNVYFETTSTYLKFQVAKQNYFKQLNKRYDNIKFAGIAVSGQEEVKQLQQIFVMPDVVKREQNAAPLPEEFIVEELSSQQRLILEQRQLARLANSSSSPILANKLLTETPSNKAVILGAPGSGKSTLVSYFAVMLTQGDAKDLGLDNNIDWLPIVIEIRDLERNLDRKILDYLHQFAESNLSTNKLPEDFFKHWLDRGNALILLDGIDEVADTGKRYKVVEKIESFLSQYDNRNIAIITSRPSGYKRDFFSTAEFPHYQLQPFDDNKIEEFINYWYDSRIDDPQEANRYKDNLNRALQKKDRIKLLAENPLILTIIALIHRNQVDLPNQRHELYDCAVKTLLTSWDEYKYIKDKDPQRNIRARFEYLKPNDLRRLMESLADWIHTQGNPEDPKGGTLINKKKLIEKLTTDIQSNKKVEFYQAEEEAKNFVEFIRTRTGLLNEQGINRYAFVHKTFQEHLCSREIYYQARSKFNFQPIEKVIKKHLHDSHWREVLLLLVSQLEGEIAVRAIRTILENKSDYEEWLHRDLFFAANCLAENPQDMKIADDGLGDKILQALVDLEVKDENKIGSKIYQEVFQVITSLTETDWEAEALKLLKEQKEKIEQFRFIKYQAALGKREQAISVLLPLLQDDNSDVRFSAAKALGKIGKADLEVIEALLPLLQDDNSDVRFSAAGALWMIGKADLEVIEALLLLLQDDNSRVRGFAAGALGMIGKAEPEVINALLPLLQDDNSDVRGFAAEALGKIGKAEPEVINALLPLLQDDNSDVRFSAAKALGKIGKADLEVIEALLLLLQDDNSRVRGFAAGALGIIGKAEPEVINALLPLLQDDNSDVRNSAAGALGMIGKAEPEVINALLPLLQDDNSDVRGFAAEALGKIGKAELEVINALLPLLQDDNSDVRGFAAIALGKIGKAELEVITLIENWLEQHQDTEDVGNGIDLLWNLVADAN